MWFSLNTFHATGVAFFVMINVQHFPWPPVTKMSITFYSDNGMIWAQLYSTAKSSLSRWKKLMQLLPFSWHKHTIVHSCPSLYLLNNIHSSVIIVFSSFFIHHPQVDVYAGAVFIQHVFNCNIYISIIILLCITGLHTMVGKSLRKTGEEGLITSNNIPIEEETPLLSMI